MTMNISSGALDKAFGEGAILETRSPNMSQLHGLRDEQFKVWNSDEVTDREPKRFSVQDVIRDLKKVGIDTDTLVVTGITAVGDAATTQNLDGSTDILNLVLSETNITDGARAVKYMYSGKYNSPAHKEESSGAGLVKLVYSEPSPDFLNEHKARIKELTKIQLGRQANGDMVSSLINLNNLPDGYMFDLETQSIVQLTNLGEYGDGVFVPALPPVTAGDLYAEDFYTEAFESSRIKQELSSEQVHLYAGFEFDYKNMFARLCEFSGAAPENLVPSKLVYLRDSKEEVEDSLPVLVAEFQLQKSATQETNVKYIFKTTFDSFSEDTVETSSSTSITRVETFDLPPKLAESYASQIRETSGFGSEVYMDELQEIFRLGHDSTAYYDISLQKVVVSKVEAEFSPEEGWYRGS